MKFQKPSLTIADQIALLRARGMAIPDRAKAEHYLLHISYYRLRAYWYILESAAPAPGEHQFVPGTSLDDAISLYIFDRRLRLLVMDAIERIEVSLRGTWAYCMATQYGPHGYLDPAHYADPLIYADNLIQLTAEVNRSTDDFIRHYKQKYTQPPMPPVWMVSEVMSLGALSKWYSSLNLRADRNRIAKAYGLDEKVMTSVAHHLSYVRNICAHHGRLWNKYLTVGMVSPSSPGSLKLAVGGAGHRKLYSTLAVLTYLMRIAAPGSDWQRTLVDLIIGCPQANPQQMGFPGDWQQRPFWKPALPAPLEAADVGS